LFKFPANLRILQKRKTKRRYTLDSVPGNNLHTEVRAALNSGIIAKRGFSGKPKGAILGAMAAADGARAARRDATAACCALSIAAVVSGPKFRAKRAAHHARSLSPPSVRNPPDTKWRLPLCRVANFRRALLNLYSQRESMPRSPRR
jgi:hypothetical protein